MFPKVDLSGEIKRESERRRAGDTGSEREELQPCTDGRCATTLDPKAGLGIFAYCRHSANRRTCELIRSAAAAAADRLVLCGIIRCAKIAVRIVLFRNRRRKKKADHHRDPAKIRIIAGSFDRLEAAADRCQWWTCSFWYPLRRPKSGIFGADDDFGYPYTTTAELRSVRPGRRTATSRCQSSYLSS